MPSTARSLIALALLASSWLGLHAASDRELRPARWPVADEVYAAPGWTVGPAAVDTVQTSEETEAIVQRTYRRVDTNQPATLVIWSHPQPQAKTQFRKGPDRDLLGAGYTIEPAPDGLIAPIEGGGAFVARRGQEAWLGMYVFGERRGRLGRDWLAWSWAEFDALLDQPNDYFLARVLVRFNPDSAALEPSAQLANVVFEHLADWYQTA